MATSYIDKAGEEVSRIYLEPMSLQEFIDQYEPEDGGLATRGDVVDDAGDPVLDGDLDAPLGYVHSHPVSVAHAPLYLLSAIEHYGTRKVVEEGEVKERYTFFDDPANDGEHAILGNTEVLNDLVEDLRSIASGRGKDDKILWVDGPTASGKSELKRCITNMLESYSKNVMPRFTVEWNINETQGPSDAPRYLDSGPGYEDNSSQDPDHPDWYKSPVQMNPLLVLPKEARKSLVDDLNALTDDPINILVDGDMTPFSAEAYNDLVQYYRHEQGVDNDELFREVTKDRHLRVTNYVVKEGQGIGILYSDDSGAPKQKLVGDWIGEMIGRFDSAGGRDARAFGYDGIVSQGNGLMTVIEDASQHPKTLLSLLNVPDEKSVRLDKGIKMDIDTLILMISNPDLEADLLDQYESKGSADKFRAMKRRLDRRKFKYLTHYGMETELLRREVANELETWEIDDLDEAEDLIRAPLNLQVRGEDGEVVDREVAPHGFEAAAVYNVVSRLEDDMTLTPEAAEKYAIASVDGFEDRDDFDILEKMLFYKDGVLSRGDIQFGSDDFEFPSSKEEAQNGIPVTVTRDAIAELINRELDRRDETVAYKHIIMPEDITEAINETVQDTAMFHSEEQEQYAELHETVNSYVFKRQEDDVLAAMLDGLDVTDAELDRYVDNIEAYVDGEPIKRNGNEEEPDDHFMRQFEIEKLGRFREDDYRGVLPGNEDVTDFRETVNNEKNYAARQNAGTIDISDLREIPALSDLLDANSWKDVIRHYDKFDPTRWDMPPGETGLDDKETTSLRELKELTIENMVDNGYSRESALMTADRVITRQFSSGDVLTRSGTIMTVDEWQEKQEEDA